MKSQTLQEFVRKIYSDEKTRSQFVSDPESVLAQFPLTETEKKAVLQTQYKMGLATSGSAQLAATVEPLTWWTSPTP